eukprot:5911839-Prymnesium_polylepis.2
MPLFDTKGWVRDFEKALKIQWEIYSNGLSPMHIVVARSDQSVWPEYAPGSLSADGVLSAAAARATLSAEPVRSGVLR